MEPIRFQHNIYILSSELYRIKLFIYMPISNGDIQSIKFQLLSVSEIKSVRIFAFTKQRTIVNIIIIIVI